MIFVAPQTRRFGCTVGTGTFAVCSPGMAGAETRLARDPLETSALSISRGGRSHPRYT